MNTVERDASCRMCGVATTNDPVTSYSVESCVEDLQVTCDDVAARVNCVVIALVRDGRLSEAAMFGEMAANVLTPLYRLLDKANYLGEAREGGGDSE